MQPNEFQEWLDYHVETFPTIKAKLNDNPKTVLVWKRLLGLASLQDAKLVTDSMAQGDIEHPAAYEWDRLATVVRTECLQLASQRQREFSESKPKSRDSGSNLGKAYAAYREVIDRGGTAEEAKQAMRDRIEVQGNGILETFHCPECFDSGLVYVWSNDSVFAYLREETQHPSWKQTMVAPCRCDEGAKWVKEEHEFRSKDEMKYWKGWRSHKVRYTPERYAIVPGNGNLYDDDAMVSLKKFVGKIRGRYTDTFAEFNDRD